MTIKLLKLVIRTVKNQLNPTLLLYWTWADHLVDHLDRVGILGKNRFRKPKSQEHYLKRIHLSEDEGCWHNGKNTGVDNNMNDSLFYSSSSQMKFSHHSLYLHVFFILCTHVKMSSIKKDSEHSLLSSQRQIIEKCWFWYTEHVTVGMNKCHIKNEKKITFT